jgi:uncharacterized protein YndB with AHSA1/START domain
LAVTSCPTDVIHARPERIWDMLTHTKELDRWLGAKLLSAPNPVIATGDHLVFTPGFGLKLLQWDILEMRPPRQLVFDVRVPFGIINHEVIVLSPVDDGRCRVTFN